jgi:hypothetical protein
MSNRHCANSPGHMKKILVKLIQLIIPPYTRAIISVSALIVTMLVATLICLAETCKTNPTSGGNEVAWPLKPSSNGRYLVDQKNKPFFINGDSPQRYMGSLTEAEAEKYFANREKYGINAVWIHLFTSWGPKVNGDPFLNDSDISTPNEAYFAHVDRFLNLARKHGIVIFLGVPGLNGLYNPDVPSYTNQGALKSYNFGRYLGNRFKNQGNIVWMIGNDFMQYLNDSIDTVVRHAADGIRETDSGHHPMTIELYPTPITSADAPKWSRYINFNLAYSYAPTYNVVQRAYNQNKGPVIFIEGVYESDGTANSCRHGYCGTPRILRSMEHWAVLSGALGGQFYGLEFDFSGIKTNHPERLNLDTDPQKQLLNLRNLYSKRRWFDLIPDSNHRIVTLGYGDCPKGAEWGYDFVNAACTTTAATADGKLVISYMERPRPATVDMTKLSGPVNAKWFNPATGEYSIITGSPLPNSGSKVFTPPLGGEGDWVLLLEAE